MTTTQTTATRDRKNGQYTERTFDRICVCGHTLGQHTAEKVGNERPCLADLCDCECFKKAKK